MPPEVHGGARVGPRDRLSVDKEQRQGGQHQQPVHQPDQWGQQPRGPAKAVWWQTEAGDMPPRKSRAPSPQARDLRPQESPLALPRLACPTSALSTQHAAPRTVVDTGGIGGASGTPAAQQGGQGVAGDTEEDKHTQGQAGAVQHAPAVGGRQLLWLHLAGWAGR